MMVLLLLSPLLLFVFSALTTISKCSEGQGFVLRTPPETYVTYLSTAIFLFTKTGIVSVLVPGVPYVPSDKTILPWKNSTKLRPQVIE